jgi:uncharacterized membrane protein
MYYTISIAYHVYGLFSQPAAFTTLVLVTLFTTFIAIVYDRKELAIIAVIGAFTTPFMVKGETNNYMAFFTYIAIINTGMLLLSYFKKWTILSKLSLFFTVLFFGGWIFSTSMFGIAAQRGLFFAHIFFVQFLGMNLFYNLRKKERFNAWEFIQLSSITILFYAVAMYFLDTLNMKDFQGSFTLCLAGFFFVIYYFLRQSKTTDTPLKLLILGKGITFVTLAGVVLFDGNHMTIFWVLESIILLLIGQKAKMPILKNAVQLIAGISFIGLGKDWILYLLESPNNNPVFNADFISFILVLGGLLSIFILTKKEALSAENRLLPVKQFRFILGGLITFALYVSCLIELNHQLRVFEFNAGNNLVIWWYHLIVLSIGLLIAYIRNSAKMQQIFTVLAFIGVSTYLIFANQEIIAVRNMAILKSEFKGFFYLHYFVVLTLIILLGIFRRVGSRILSADKQDNWASAFVAIVVLILATFELDHIALFNFSAEFVSGTILRHTQTEGYTVLWGIGSLVIMVIGMRKQWKTFRILALVIFSISLLKLFTSDIRHITDAGKIIAFISLGILLLIVSFLYQKLKKLIVEGK